MDRKTEAQLLTAMAAAQTQEEQRRLAGELDALRAEASSQAINDAMWGTQVTPAPHRAPYSTASLDSDWLMDMAPTVVDASSMDTDMRAQASRWYSDTLGPLAKEDGTELMVQASGVARYLASQYGEVSGKAYSTFMEQVRHHATTEGHDLSDLPDPYEPGENGEDTETKKTDTPSLEHGDAPETGEDTAAPLPENLDASTWPSQDDATWNNGDEPPGKSASRSERTSSLPASVSDHDATPESGAATAYDLCKTCGWPVEKKGDGWVHESKNPAEWTDKRKSASRKTASAPTLDQIMAYEQGEMTSEEEVLEFFQALVDSGLAWSLQGHYGRTARDLIDAGLVTEASRKTAAARKTRPRTASGAYESKPGFEPGDRVYSTYRDEYVTIVSIEGGKATVRNEAGETYSTTSLSKEKTASRKTAAPSDGQRSYCRICGIEMEGQDYAWYALKSSTPKRDVGQHHHLPARNRDWPGEFNAQGDLVPGTPGGGGGQYDAPAGTIYDAGGNTIRVASRKTASGGWVTVVYMDGDEGREVVDRLANVEGVVAHGATEESIQAAAEYLAEWDYGVNDNVSSDEPWGRSDDTAEVTVNGTQYTLAWNTGLGYVSLQRKVGHTASRRTAASQRTTGRKTRRAAAARKTAAQFSSFEELEAHVRGLMAKHPDLVSAAEAAYERQDQSWFDAQSTEDLKVLWEIAASAFFVSWDDEVYDALADRPNGFEASKKTAGSRKTAAPWVWVDDDGSDDDDDHYGEQGACIKCGADVEFVGVNPSDFEKQYGSYGPHNGWWDRGGNYECPQGGYHESTGAGEDDDFFEQMKGQGNAWERQASRKTASVSLKNVGIESETVGVGTDPQGNKVRFRLTPQDHADLKSILFSDLAINFSGVEIEESDIIKDASRKTASGPTHTWSCQDCGATVERYRGQGDVTCPRCGAWYNAFGQRLRDDWRGNPSTWDDEVGDLEGFEQQHSRWGSRTAASIEERVLLADGWTPEEIAFGDVPRHARLDNNR